MRRLVPAILALSMLIPQAARADDAVPTEIGACVATTIAEVTTRLDGVPDSGSAIAYDNGVWGVSYEQIAAVDASAAGDAVELCLTALPGDCPPGDERGKVYFAVNLRTQESWELADAEHMCGGA